MTQNKQTAVEWLMNELANSGLLVTKDINNLVAYNKAKQMEIEQKANMPIHIHGGIKNTTVYVENGIIHVMPTKQFNHDTEQ